MLYNVQRELTRFGPKLSPISKLPSPLGETHIPFDLGEIPKLPSGPAHFPSEAMREALKTTCQSQFLYETSSVPRAFPGNCPCLSCFLKHHDPHKWSCLEEKRGFPGGAGGKEPVSQSRGLKETRVRPLGQEDLLEKGMATCSSIHAWGVPWTEEPGRLPSIGS